MKSPRRAGALEGRLLVARFLGRILGAFAKFLDVLLPEALVLGGFALVAVAAGGVGGAALFALGRKCAAIDTARGALSGIVGLLAGGRLVAVFGIAA